MPLAQPRLDPLSESEQNDEQRALMAKAGAAPQLNIFRTLVRHPDLYRASMRFGAYVLGASTLEGRSRELLILRTAHLCRCTYEVYQHRRIGPLVGLAVEELDRIVIGPSAPEWSQSDRVLLQAADELHASQSMSEATHAALAKDWNEKQLMDIVFTVGHYTVISMFLNTFRVQIEKS
jgi:4-carboxymuconolactone decarboxylase